MKKGKNAPKLQAAPYLHSHSSNDGGFMWGSKIILLSFLLTGATSSATLSHVYCKATTDRVALIRGPKVNIAEGNFAPALQEALTRLWNFCGGKDSNTCEKPATCYTIDEFGNEYEIGKYY